MMLLPLLPCYWQPLVLQQAHMCTVNTHVAALWPLAWPHEVNIDLFSKWQTFITSFFKINIGRF